MSRFDFLIAGAGFAGAVCAERLASAGRRVLVVDRRPHIGGNAHDGPDAHGVLIHTYGPHLFHTNSDRVFAYLSRFTAWRPYQHRVLTEIDGELVPFPINRTTINRLYHLDLDGAGVEAFLAARRERREPVLTSEDVVLGRVGRDLCDKFYRGYTRKQWNLDLSELAPEVAGRIPVRFDDDDRYFTDTHQAIPAESYTAMFERMLAHPNIELRLGVSYEEVAPTVEWSRLIYTGPIDRYFGRRFGELPYRSLRFEPVHLPGVALVQPVGTINYPNDHAYTRSTEYKHVTGQIHSGTTLSREYPIAEGEPHYPILAPANLALYEKYLALARNEPNTCFLGRLAEYRYYNMDQIVEAALDTADRLLGETGAAAPPGSSK